MASYVIPVGAVLKLPVTATFTGGGCGPPPAARVILGHRETVEAEILDGQLCIRGLAVGQVRGKVEHTTRHPAWRFEAKEGADRPQPVRDDIEGRAWVE